MNGEPLAEVWVLFAPKKTGNSALVGEISRALTDENGCFVLKTGSGIKGALVGPHQVAISGEIRSEIRDEILVPEWLPPKYHEGVELTFEVPHDGTDLACFSLEGSFVKKKRT
ncbi:MAG: hypothetical protein C0478_12665 [Planctomyces sp.]|nr:hypothetical protein [Planctomyces sp.]